MWPAFFMAYDDANCEFGKLASKEIDDLLKYGPELVSAKFVIPYPPGYNKAWINLNNAGGSSPYFDIWRLDFIFRM